MSSTHDAYPTQRLPPALEAARRSAFERAKASASSGPSKPVDLSHARVPLPDVEPVDDMEEPEPASEQTPQANETQQVAEPALPAVAQAQKQSPVAPVFELRPVVLEHPIADITVMALDVIITPQLITLLLPISGDSALAPKQSTEFTMRYQGVQHIVMAVTQAGKSGVFPCSVISFLRLSGDDGKRLPSVEEHPLRADGEAGG